MSWENCKLWTLISAKNNKNISLTVENSLPDVEKVLRSGGTSPLDFTLHDDQHSFRVAERMVTLAPHQVPLLSDIG